MTRCPPGSPSSGLVNQMLPIVSRDRVSIVIVPAGTPAATAICAAAVASARGGGGSYMPYAPDITIRCARPERYSAAARRARATVAGRGRCRVRVPEHADAFGNPTSDKRQPTVELLMWISQTPGSLPLTLSTCWIQPFLLGSQDQYRYSAFECWTTSG